MQQVPTLSSSTSLFYSLDTSGRLVQAPAPAAASSPAAALEDTSQKRRIGEVFDKSVSATAAEKPKKPQNRQKKRIYDEGSIKFKGYFNEEGLPHRKGTMIFADGRQYKGNCENGLPHGLGTMTFPDGREYKGNWHRGLQHGHGSWKTNEGTYEGSFQDGLPNGYGVMTYANGDRYSGQWKNGQIFGSITATSGNNTYKGTWQNGGWVGKVTCVNFNENFEYEGDVKDLKFHGQGKLVQNKGRTNQVIITGTFSEGSCIEGRMEHATGKYEGKMQNDLPQGTGTLYIGNFYKYNGEFNLGKPHGKGEIIFSEGGTFEGKWDNGSNIEGQGRVIIKGFEAHPYNGSVKLGRPWTGSGAIIDTENSMIKGVWKEGKIEPGFNTYFYIISDEKGVTKPRFTAHPIFRFFVKKKPTEPK